MAAISIRYLVLGILLSLSACSRQSGGKTTPGELEIREDAQALEKDPTHFEAVVLSRGPEVRRHSKDCVTSVEELCNALDDNCDGKIDEGCGYEGGLIQVSAAWSSGADIDLYVQGPLGETVSFQRPFTPSGGQMNQIGRGDCASERANSRVENIRWVGSAVPEGDYRVQVHHWGECLSSAGSTTLIVSVRVGDQIIGVYTLTMRPGQRRDVVQLKVSKR